MLFDLTVSDAAFVDGRPPKDIKETIEWARQQLKLDGERAWHLISARTKLGRMLFEIEEETEEGPKRYIGKVGRSERSEVLHRTLTMLRDAGFRPPSRITVPEPVAYLPERGLVLQEKVPGHQANELILQSTARGCFAAADCARWLAALHQCGVPATPASIDDSVVSHWARELAEVQPDEAACVEKLAAAALEEIARPAGEAMPSHGDFHPMNVFILGTQRITGIDIDKFAAREPESDIGWFLMQTAAFGFFQTGTFESTERARRAFIQCYEAETGRAVDVRRAALFMTMAFLKNLHFELVLLKTGRAEYTRPWLKAAASAILEEDLYLSEDS
jgi:aminoglycoside phosphotransferase (APT) family kinase protein